MTQINISNQIKSFAKYLKKPSFDLKNNTRLTLLFWFLLVFSANFTAVILGLLSNFILSKVQYQGQNQILDTIVSTPIWFFLLLAVIQAPITEEISFRLFLNPTKLKLSLCISGFAFYMLTSLSSFGLVFYYDFLDFLPVLLSNIINSIALGFIIYLILKFNNIIYEKVKNFIVRHYSWFFYASSILFGLIHIQNFSNLDFFANLYWLLPILVLPQTFVGVVLGYIRVRNGITSAILAHALYNLITSIPFVILSFLPRLTFENLLRANTTNIEIEFKIENLEFFEKLILVSSSLASLVIMGIGCCSFVYLAVSFYKKSDIVVAKYN